MKFSHLALLTLLIIGVCADVHKASALTVSPVRVEIDGNPGQTLRGEMEVYNEQPEDKTFYSSFENFEPSGDTGSPKFIGDTGNLSTWIKTSDQINIAPEEKIIVPYTITIPENAEPGGYFAAIFWGEQNPAAVQGGEVSIGGKLGVLVLLRVNGDIHEEAGISDFITTDSKRLFTMLPIGFSYRFTNKGQDRVAPLGDLTIKNTFGATVATLKANESEGNVLPNSTRTFKQTWGKDEPQPAATFFAVAKQQLTSFHFGFYKAEVAVVWGSENTLTTATTWFLMFPWQLLSIAAVLLLILLIVVKQYNRWIVARSKSSS
jgi:hypothetical protein